MTDDPGGAEPIFVLRASPMRRGFATAVLGCLGALLIWLGVSTAPEFGWRLLLLGFGAGALWLMVRLWQATSGAVLLTEAGLADADGRMLAPLAQVVAVERGAFAFKPSNGFVVRLSDKAPRGWAPGLWWRVGRHLGVGGVTSAAHGKAMAEILSIQIARRDGLL